LPLEFKITVYVLVSELCVQSMVSTVRYDCHSDTLEKSECGETELVDLQVCSWMVVGRGNLVL